MQSMSLQKKQDLETLGFTVTVKTDPKRRRLFTYVKHPDNNPNDPLSGLEVKYFNNLKEITHDLIDDGETVDIDYYCWPVDDCPPYQHEPGYGYDAAVEYWDQSYNTEHGLAWWTFWLICAAIAMTATVLVSLACFFIEKISAPCNYEENWINDCWVSITNTDCKHDEFNTCGGPDYNGDGKPDGQWSNNTGPEDPGSPEWKGGADWLAIFIGVAIGVAIIGGTYIAVKVIPKIKQRKAQKEETV